MTFQGDPYRVLGVGPGASLNEIRSAYRRLVKQWHPDAAGDRALPRFLAIQAAYERLVDPEGRLRPATGRRAPDAPGGGAGAGPGGGGRPGPSRPSAADPGRARASRDAWRARRAGWGAGGAGSAGTGATGARDAGAAGGRTGNAGAGAAGPAGGTGAGPGGGEAGAAPRGARPGSRDGEPGRGPRERRAHHRTTRKATPGSTTYDEATEPLDPAWGGAGWYGASSGTYWTLNPREYADPRKHGPEYLARARRATPGGADPDDDPGGVPDADTAAADADTAAADADAPATAARGTAPGETDATGSGAWRWSSQDRTATQGDPHDWGAHGWSFAADPATADPAHAPGDRRPGPRGGRPDSRRGPRPAPRPGPAAAPPAQGGIPDLEPYLRRMAPANLRRLALGPDRRWRLIVALVAWPPIGVAVASLIDVLTGCGVFAVSCGEPARLLPVAAQPLIVLLLAALPAFAASAAFAGLVALASALPAATIIAVGSRWQPEAARALLALVVAAAYLVALVVPGWRERRRPGRGDPGPGEPSGPGGGALP